MASRVNSDARINFRLPGELKAVIEQAAAQMGQSISDFAVSTLVRSARRVMQQTAVTELSKRDRDMFLEMLDDIDARPNKALRQAGRQYKKRVISRDTDRMGH